MDIDILCELVILTSSCLYHVYRSERKTFYHKERQRIQNLKEGVTQDGPSTSYSAQPGTSVTADVVTPLRLPRETSQAQRLLDPSMGLGRGMNPHKMEETIPGHSSLAEHSLLGLGRGASAKVEPPFNIVAGRGKHL
jgi:hypothetical protein